MADVVVKSSAVLLLGICGCCFLHLSPPLRQMPNVLGFIISMYLDNKQHNLSRIHVKYQDEEAVISIIDGQLPEGNLK